MSSFAEYRCPEIENRIVNRFGTSRAVVLAFFILFTVFAATRPVDFVKEQPGEAINTLGKYEGKDIISVSGVPTYESKSKLELTTVSVFGNPDNGLLAVQVVLGWINPQAEVLPTEAVYGHVTTAQANEAGRQQMRSAQSNAVTSAFVAAGYRIPTTLKISYVAPQSRATGLIKEGDVIIALQANGKRQEVHNYQEILEMLSTIAPDSLVTLEVERGGKPLSATFATISAGEGRKDSLLGLGLDVDEKLPAKVGISLGEVQGPSAGLMFSLGLYDKLTVGDLAGDLIVAGTGTVDGAGRVGPIGGVQHKVVAAQNTGATVFLTPEENCQELVNLKPNTQQIAKLKELAKKADGLQTLQPADSHKFGIYQVKTLQDAIDVLTQLKDQKPVAAKYICPAKI